LAFDLKQQERVAQRAKANYALLPGWSFRYQ